MSQVWISKKTITDIDECFGMIAADSACPGDKMECSGLGNCLAGACICYKPNFADDCLSCNNGFYDAPDCEGTRIIDYMVTGPILSEISECDCDRFYTERDVCDKMTGACICRDPYEGDLCDECINEYFDFPYCDPCDCNEAGSVNNICDKTTGICTCRPGFVGDKCDSCDTLYEGDQCESCVAGYYDPSSGCTTRNT